MVKAKELTFAGDYEASDKLLLTYTGKKDNLYNLCMMINAFQQNNKDLAEKHLKILEDSFEPLPRRYEVLIWILREDIDRWRSEDLADIGRDMKVSANRLRVARGGEKTQFVQKEIIRKLDKHIKDLEDKANGDNGKGDKNEIVKSGKSNGKGNPAADLIVAIESGEGKIDDKKLRTIAESWGTMPPAQRAKVVQDITRDLPSRYRVIIEEYFKALSKMENK